MWLPIENGGEGLYERMKPDVDLHLKDGDCASDVLIADGFTAGAGFIIEAVVIAAVGSALCPVCAVGVVVGVGLNAAVASVATYRNSVNCQEQ